MARNLRSADGLLAHEVAATVDRLEHTDDDKALIALAKHYADVIDRAESAVEDAEAALDGIDLADAPTRKLIYRLKAKVEAHTTLAELGPKLQAALESLGASPTARAKLKGGAPSSGPSQLDAMRRARGA